MTQTPDNPFNPFGPSLISRQRLYWCWWVGRQATKLFREYVMSMEKRGVTQDEGEPPTTKEAKDGGCKPNCCQQACGTDPLSKAAEAAADAKAKAIKDK
jgi:hypothetical protein